MTQKLIPIIATFFLIGIGTSCSLFKVELESEAVPLSQLAMNQRIATHNFGYDFIEAITYTADSIVLLEDDPMVEISALQWKISSTKTCSRSIFITEPEISFVQTWAMVLAHRNFIHEKAPVYLGSHYTLATEVSDSLLVEFEDLATSFYKDDDFNALKEFVYQFVEEHPFNNAEFKHESIIHDWKTFKNIPDSALVTTVGTLPQVMTNFSDKATFLAESVPSTAGWNMELWRKNMATDTTMNAQIDSIRMMAQEVGALAQKSPELVDSAMMQLDHALAQLQGSANMMMDNFDRNWQYSLVVLTQERLALTESIAQERSIVMAELDSISVNVADKAMGHIQKTVRSVLVFVIIIVILLFGIPFFSGYYMARYRFKK